MNPSTASGRLVKDILWSLIVQTNKDNCCKCGEKMTRETFSIEHKIPWLDSENPIELFFDLDNISFSHLSCNISDARKPEAICGTYTRYSEYKCRCEPCRDAASVHRAKYYTSDKRRARYQQSKKVNMNIEGSGYAEKIPRI